MTTPAENGTTHYLGAILRGDPVTPGYELLDENAVITDAPGYYSLTRTYSVDGVPNLLRVTTTRQVDRNDSTSNADLIHRSDESYPGGVKTRLASVDGGYWHPGTPDPGPDLTVGDVTAALDTTSTLVLAKALAVLATETALASRAQWPRPTAAPPPAAARTTLLDEECSTNPNTRSYGLGRRYTVEGVPGVLNVRATRGRTDEESACHATWASAARLAGPAAVDWKTREHQSSREAPHQNLATVSALFWTAGTPEHDQVTTPEEIAAALGPVLDRALDTALKALDAHAVPTAWDVAAAGNTALFETAGCLLGSGAGVDPVYARGVVDLVTALLGLPPSGRAAVAERLGWTPRTQAAPQDEPPTGRD